MTTIAKISCILIGISFSLRLHTPIAFGTSIGLALVFILIEEKKKCFSLLRDFTKSPVIPYFIVTLFSFLTSSMFSILPLRSFLVVIYLFSFVILSFLFFSFLKNKKERIFLVLNFFLISVFFSSLLVFFYNLTNYEINYEVNKYIEVKKYKGFVNILTILIFLTPFFEKKLGHAKPYISIFMFLIIFPIIITSNCNAAILGILGGCGLSLLFLVLNKFKKRKKIVIISILFFSISIFSLLNILSKKYNSVVNSGQNFIISTKILDAHRQIIWGFSFKEFKKKAIFGIGPDTSNFIEGSQEIISHPLTGDMPYIPSHPHNILVELLLETGIFGLVSFLLLIFSINYYFLRNKNFYNKIHIIFFNGYFWTSSLVNFSFWAAWWQGSYFLVLALLFAASNFRYNANDD